jgi:uncharacterized protein GlcG (DUF336 family)
VTGSMGDLIAFAAMDDVVSAAADGAVDKARTSASLHRATSDLQDLVAANPALGLGLAVRPQTVIYGGGVPLLSGDGRVVGAVGVSGCSTAEADHAYAEAAARPLTT